MERRLLEKVNANSGRIFREKYGRAQLEVSVIDRIDDEAGNHVVGLLPHKKQISQAAEFKDSSTPTSDECSRIYTIRHVRSWSTLDISRSLFDQLMTTHKIFPELWRVILAFGERSFDNEFGFPTPQAKESRAGSLISQELAYVIQRVEPNGRLAPKSPWSIRQTGVYQKLEQSEDIPDDPKALLLLVAPSSATENSISNGLSGQGTGCVDLIGSALSVHGCIVAESLEGWADYMYWLEEQLKLRSARIMTSSIYGGSDTRPAAFFEKDRVGLRQLEDYINDLAVILCNMIHTIKQIKQRCQHYCSVYCSNKQPCSCRLAMQVLDGYAAEAQNYQGRARVLQTRVQSIQNCLSNSLRYRESVDIKQLTIRNALDATAVKLLTIIAMVFLPMTLVENFFSTQFVTTVGGGLQVSVYALVMAAVAVPLTGLVFLGWRLWLRYECSQFQHCVSSRRRFDGMFGSEKADAIEVVELLEA